MNTLPSNFIVDSCQYTPVYLVQDTGAIQGRTYILTQGNEQEAKPVTNNLKRFYENSGILENNLTSNVPNIIKPRIQKNKQLKAGNNLKLANFLQPKNNIDNFSLPKSNINNTININKQCIPISNIILKPTVVNANVVNTVVREEIDRKIVKIKNFPECLKKASREKAIPKTKPKEEPSTTPPIKCTSVQLLKLGETYHSINQLSDDQMKMVNKALKIFSNPEKSMEPLYDPVTNTRYVYKVVSPRDLTVVHNNNLVLNAPKHEVNEIKKEPKKIKSLPVQEKEVILKKLKTAPTQQKKTAQEKEMPKYTEKAMDNYDSEPEQPVEIKVTRSGRKVKLPKQIIPQTSQKPKKKNMGIVSCFQCSTEFCSFYRLQKHYESHPTHIPANIHSNLFHCLLAIIKSGPEEDRANIFIQQLELLVEKIKSVLPCLLKTVDGSDNKPCNINDDIGRLFGLEPGQYNLNIDALTCVKNIDGNCRHHPQHNINESSSSVLLPTQNHDKVNIKKDSDESEGLSAFDKLPTANKRQRKSKQQKSPDAKKSRLGTENSDPIIEFGIEDLVNFSTNDESAINVKPEDISLLDNLDLVVDNEVPADQPIITDNQCRTNYALDQTEKTAIPYMQFHSTHFDIRSSPIKPSAAVFNKIQINPDNLSKYESQIIRPLELDTEPKTQDESLIPTNSPPTPDLQSMLKDEIAQLSSNKDNVNIHDLSYDKDWMLDAVNEKSNESFIRTNGAIEPSLLHIEEFTGKKLQTNNPAEPNDQSRVTDNHILSSQNSSVMNFLESLGNECLLYPETDIRNNHVECVDFQLDLFSFSNP